MQYTLDYFIKKYTAIPVEEWTTCTLEDPLGRHCAMGHLSNTDYYCLQSMALEQLVGDYIQQKLNNYNKTADPFKKLWEGTTGVPRIAAVNDDSLGKVFPGDGPKERVLNLLHEIKEYNESQVAVDQVNQILAEPRKELALLTI